MKKAIFMCYILGGLLLIPSNLFAQDNFENCFKNERTKAKTKGATSSEAITQATNACRGNQKTKNSTKKNSFKNCLKTERLKLKSEGVTAAKAVKLATKICNLKFTYRNNEQARASQVLGKPENNHLIKDTIGISTLNGVAFERVYEAGHGRKISELEWDISNLLMLDLSRSFEVFPNVYIGVGLSKAINSGSGGKMTDTDWLGYDSSDWEDGRQGTNEWTDKSFHNVDIVEAYEQNLFIYYELLSTTQSNLKFKFGFKETFFEWKDFAQNYVYSSDTEDSNDNKILTGFRDIQGSFGGITGILYWQKFQVPYLGISYVMNFKDKLTADFSFAYSANVSASSRDRHLLRSLEIIDDFRGGEYYEVGVDLKYKTKSNVSINGLLYYQYIPEIIGNGHYYFIGQSDDADSFIHLDGAAISNEFFKLGLSASYSF